MKKEYKLTAIVVQKIIKAGRFSDGINNLNLLVKKTGTKSWVFRYTRYSKRKQMGLGAYPALSLKDAREAAAELYKKLKADHTYDPILERNKAVTKAKLEQQEILVTFKWCAEQLIESKSAGWKNPKSAKQWSSSLTTYVYPIFGDYPVKEVNDDLVLRVLKPIWTTKTETANRIRTRIGSVLSWAAVQKYRTKYNPTLWKDHLEHLLASPSDIKEVRHHKALPYKEIHSFITELRTRETMSAFALEFLILTAARTGEIMNAVWSQIDFENNTWTRPVKKVKGKKEHILTTPLPTRAVEIINHLYEVRTNDYIFQGGKANKGLSNAAMDKLLQVTMKYDVTVHGFRSTFRDWSGDETHYQNEMCELAIAHKISSKSEKAYRRSDMLEKRRQLMQDWQNYIDTESTTAKVISINKAVKSK